MIAHPDHSVKANLLLASASPRRRELIKLLGLPVATTAADIDEVPLPGERADDMAQRLSREKAVTVSALTPALCAGASVPQPSSLIVLASDTVVSLDGEPLGKPRDAAEARSMLQRLRNRTHQVYTGITLIDTEADRLVTDLAGSAVRMRDYSDAEIDAYIASGDPFDKAGAYAIQHAGFHPADRFDHCFANVMGLPLCHVVRALRQLGVEPIGDVPVVCQSYLNYQCPVYEKILTSDE
jgi:septum formation protein